MIKSIIFLAILIVSNHLSAQEMQNSRITTNPLNLSYRFQIDGVSRREAADPVIVLYKDRYFVFASHSSGYWYSSDLKNWDYVASKNLKTVEAWAPAVLVYKDAIYYLGMGEKRIFKSTDPIHDQWEEIESKSKDYGDPAFFQDYDGRSIPLLWMFGQCSYQRL